VQQTMQQTTLPHLGSHSRLCPAAACCLLCAHPHPLLLPAAFPVCCPSPTGAEGPAGRCCHGCCAADASQRQLRLRAVTPFGRGALYQHQRSPYDRGACYCATGATADLQDMSAHTATAQHSGLVMCPPQSLWCRRAGMCMCRIACLPSPGTSVCVCSWRLASHPELCRTPAADC
jgi:hypothetical protein